MQRSQDKKELRHAVKHMLHFIHEARRLRHLIEYKKGCLALIQGLEKAHYIDPRSASAWERFVLHGQSVDDATFSCLLRDLKLAQLNMEVLHERGLLDEDNDPHNTELQQNNGCSGAG